MTEAIEVTTGARLHFGPLAVGAATGRAFGGIGMMVDQPQLRVRVAAAESDVFEGPPELTDRVSRLLEHLRREAPEARRPLAIESVEALPAHSGFGSGTQLSLAIAQAILGEQRAAPEDLARWTGRGMRSAIGVHGFLQGGFLVDAGKRAENELGALAARVPFPEAWRVLLWTGASSDRISGDRERAAFRRLPAMTSETTSRLCTIVLRELLPALDTVDFTSFSNALREYGDTVGRYFAPAQGGVYADPGARDVVAWLDREGFHGIAQTSWGPTLAVAAPDEATARTLMGRWPFPLGTLRLTRGLNEGAEVRPVSPQGPSPA